MKKIKLIFSIVFANIVLKSGAPANENERSNHPFLTGASDQNSSFRSDLVASEVSLNLAEVGSSINLHSDNGTEEELQTPRSISPIAHMDESSDFYLDDFEIDAEQTGILCDISLSDLSDLPAQVQQLDYTPKNQVIEKNGKTPQIPKAPKKAEPKGYPTPNEKAEQQSHFGEYFNAGSQFLQSFPTAHVAGFAYEEEVDSMLFGIPVAVNLFPNFVAAAEYAVLHGVGVDCSNVSHGLSDEEKQNSTQNTTQESEIDGTSKN